MDQRRDGASAAPLAHQQGNLIEECDTAARTRNGLVRTTCTRLPTYPAIFSHTRTLESITMCVLTCCMGSSSNEARPLPPSAYAELNHGRVHHVNMA